MAIAYLMDFFAIGLGMYGLYKISNENIEGVIPYMALIVFLFIFTFMMVKKRGEELWIDLLVIGMIVATAFAIRNHVDWQENTYLIIAVILALLASCMQFMEELKIHFEKRQYQDAVDKVQKGMIL